ncbi:MAG: hypothetical protein IJT82_03435 [Schwartzia sp.]|nr:hypothetical protein [Schwartzia sp. (in: firmicutes)]
MLEIDSVVIDAVKYTVERTDIPIIVDGEQCRGDVDYNLARIRLSSNMEGAGREPQTLMHEIVHAMMYERDIEECNNERVVNSIASGVINLICNNPELVKFISTR